MYKTYEIMMFKYIQAEAQTVTVNRRKRLSTVIQRCQMPQLSVLPLLTKSCECVYVKSMLQSSYKLTNVPK